MNFIKHLIPLFLVFSFTVNANSYPQSNNTAYYKRTEIVLRNELKIDSKAIYYLNLKSYTDNPFRFLIYLVKHQSLCCSHKIRTVFKLQTLIYLHLADFVRRRYIKLHNSNSSSISYSSLYIA